MSMLGKGDMDAHDRMIAAEAKELPGTRSSIRYPSLLFSFILNYVKSSAKNLIVLLN